MNEKKQKYKISSNSVSYSFDSPQELQAFVTKQKIKSCAFSIIDFQKISETCNKETETLNLNATF